MQLPGAEARKWPHLIPALLSQVILDRDKGNIPKGFGFVSLVRRGEGKGEGEAGERLLRS